MTNEFHVSVIIAVYNAERFVTQAVQSALAQPETAEVILIEDGSPDDALEVCQSLAKKHSRVRLLRHPDGENRGAPASFNLGMQNARYEYIAILGADDYYLPDRFKVAKEIFVSNPDCDGVYEAIGRHIENQEDFDRWRAAGRPDQNLHTVKGIFSPEELGEILITGVAGDFSLNGLVFNRRIIPKIGFMNENLKLHQDTDFIIKLAIKSKLLPGRLDEPVAKWRVHAENRISAPRTQKQIHVDLMKMWKSIHDWLKKQEGYSREKIVLQKSIMNSYIRSKPLSLKWMGKLPSEFRKIIRLGLLPLEIPIFITKQEYWNTLFSIPLGDVFARNFAKLFNFISNRTES